MGSSGYDEEVKAAEAVKGKVKLLVCKCEACTTWEIGHRGEKRHHLFLLCKTCGLEIPIKQFEIDDHNMLHWNEHER